MIANNVIVCFLVADVTGVRRSTRVCVTTDVTSGRTPIATIPSRVPKQVRLFAVRLILFKLATNKLVYFFIDLTTAPPTHHSRSTSRAAVPPNNPPRRPTPTNPRDAQLPPAALFHPLLPRGITPAHLELMKHYQNWPAAAAAGKCPAVIVRSKETALIIFTAYSARSCYVILFQLPAFRCSRPIFSSSGSQPLPIHLQLLLWLQLSPTRDSWQRCSLHLVRDWPD